MWIESFGKKIAEYMELIATVPNNRPDPESSGVMIFDGGKRTVMTGLTKYEFSDGSRALYGSGSELALTMKFATGEEVLIQITPKACDKCGNLFGLGEVKNYCSQCGSEQ